MKIVTRPRENFSEISIEFERLDTAGGFEAFLVPHFVAGSPISFCHFARHVAPNGSQLLTLCPTHDTFVHGCSKKLTSAIFHLVVKTPRM